MNARNLLPLATLSALIPISLQVTVAQSNSTAAMPDNEAQAAARSALYENPPSASAQTQTATTASAQAAPTTVAATASLPDTDAQAKARAALREEEAAAQPDLTPGTAPDNEAQAAARAILYQGEAPAAVAATATPAPSSTAVTTAPSSTASAMKSPDLPTTPEQQQQLNQLLQQYRADQISASEYHTRRAQIIANK